MKVLFINNGTTHYYNLVLNKLSRSPDIELKLLVPSVVSRNIGDGVYQTREGLSFPVLELPERTILGIFVSFRGLARLIFRERPDIIITADTYIYTFLFDLPVVFVRKMLGIKLIMKSIPFRVPAYPDARRAVLSSDRGIDRLPHWMNWFLLRTGVIRLIRIVQLYLKKTAFRIPDGHVNYIDDAFEILGSYGVPRDRIFITRNSPDTDMLFSIRDALAASDPVLPACDHRLVHVGRLVAWKRVDMLLRAFARIKRDFKDAELLIIGSGPEEATLRNLSSEIGVAGSVRFLGGIYDPHQLGRYLMSSSVYVLAGMGGLSINEAMCYGLPIICSVGDGTEKVLVRDGINGLYFRDGDEGDLTEKIRTLFNDPRMCRTMGERSTDIIRTEVNIDSVIRGYLDALDHLVQGAAHSRLGAQSRRVQ